MLHNNDNHSALMLCLLTAITPILYMDYQIQAFIVVFSILICAHNYYKATHKETRGTIGIHIDRRITDHEM